MKSFTKLSLAGGLLPFLAFTTFSSSVSAEDILRFGVQNSEPKYVVSTEAEAPIGGLCGEIYQALQLKLADKGIVAEVEEKPKPVGQIMADLDEGALHGYCGGGRNEVREKQFIYSTRPLYEVANTVVVHKDETAVPKSFQDLRDLNAVIGGLKGASSARYLQLSTGIPVDDSYEDLETALKQLASGEDIRFFFYHDLGLVYLVRKLGLPLKVLPAKFRVYNHWMMYSRKAKPELIEAVETALLELEVSGHLAEITQKYTIGN